MCYRIDTPLHADVLTKMKRAAWSCTHNIPSSMPSPIICKHRVLPLCYVLFAEHTFCTILGTVGVQAPAEQLPSNKHAPIVAFCASGNRSSTAKAMLEGLGYTAVLNGGGCVKPTTSCVFQFSLSPHRVPNQEANCCSPFPRPVQSHSARWRSMGRNLTFLLRCVAHAL
jgi:rhodanese-related sulfurtransferase